MNDDRRTVLFACDYWHPKESPNVICLERLLPLVNNEYKALFVTADGLDAPLPGPNCISIPDLGIATILKETKGHPVKRALIKIGYKLVVARNLFRYPIRSGRMVEDFKQAMDSFLSQGNIDAVIAICFPGESVEACLKLKKLYPTVHFFIYFLDEVAVGMYEKGIFVRGISSKAAARFEKKVIKSLDGAIFLSSARDLVEQNHGRNNPKIRFADVPLLTAEKPTYRFNGGEDSPLDVLYTGSLFEPDRDPRTFLEAMRPLMDDGSVRFLFAGNTSGLLDFAINEGLPVRDLGFLSSDACSEAVKSADVLLSIGNKDPNLVPSKLFQYLNAAKPIIHLKRGMGDACLPYLEKYPLALVVEEGESRLDERVQRFLQGLSARDGTEIPLKGLYPKAFPEYTIAALKDLEKLASQKERQE